MAKIKVENTEISVVSVQNEDYISLTDMAHSQMQEHIIFRWMSLKSTIEYLGEWEKLYNPNFNWLLLIWFNMVLLLMSPLYLTKQQNRFF